MLTLFTFKPVKIGCKWVFWQTSACCSFLQFSACGGYFLQSHGYIIIKNLVLTVRLGKDWIN